MRPFTVILLAFLAILLAAASPTLAAGRWVKQCSPNGCRMVWQEQPTQVAPVPRVARAQAAPAPTDAYCACKGGCRCMATGQPSAECSKPGSAFATCPRYPAAKAKRVQVPQRSGSGWYLGKNLGF